MASSIFMVLPYSSSPLSRLSASRALSADLKYTKAKPRDSRDSGFLTTVTLLISPMSPNFSSRCFSRTRELRLLT